MNMNGTENRIQALNIIVLLALSIIGCIVGSYVMNHISNSMLGFNVPAIGVLVIGELVRVKISGILSKHWNKQEDRSEAAA